MHFCADEWIALTTLLGSIRLAWPWLKARWQGRCVKLEPCKHECKEHQ